MLNLITLTIKSEGHNTKLRIINKKINFTTIMITACGNILVQSVLLNHSIFHIAVNFKITAANTSMVKRQFPVSVIHVAASTRTVKGLLLCTRHESL
jgi:hypothetical protein